MKKRIFIYMMLGLALLTGCAKTTETAPTTTAENSSSADSTAESADAALEENAFIITLYPDTAPITCENFEKLVSEGFYNGLTFHRVVDNFMAQGGDPEGTGMGGSEQTIKGEFASNGVENNLSHQRGIVSMARSQDPDSASSQFFICYGDESFLDGNYAAFGEVTQGMEIVDNFLNVERVMSASGEMASPTTPIVMKEVKMIDPDEENHPRVEVIMDDFLK
ncbi:MAG: peptidylprolyl isomerase [Oscillospiraceae bacterium]|nr:peptidylprolyl isomerase [Oscillospiraceae bacterium]